MNSFSPLSKIPYEVADTSSVCQSGRAANFRHESPVEPFLPKDAPSDFSHLRWLRWDASTVIAGGTSGRQTVPGLHAST